MGHRPKPQSPVPPVQPTAVAHTPPAARQPSIQQTARVNGDGHGVSKVEIAGAPRGVPAARRHREIHAFCRLFAPYESLDLIRA